RQAVADKLKRENDLDYAPEEIIVSCGAKQALYNVAMVLLDAGDEVLIPGPYWVTYPTQVLLAGGTPVIIPTTVADDFKITGDLLRRYLTPKTKGIFLNTPGNPPGGGRTRQQSWKNSPGSCSIPISLSLLTKSTSISSTMGSSRSALRRWTQR